MLTYTATTTNATNTITATAAEGTVAITVNGAEHTSGTPATWQIGANEVEITVTNAGSTAVYTVTVTK